MIIKQLKFKISLNELVKDRTRCPAIQGFVRSVPNFDRTLSVDRPLFGALRDARPLGTFENQDSRDGKTQYI